MRRLLPTLVILAVAALAHAATTPEDMIKDAQQLEKDSKIPQAAKLYEEFLRLYADHTQVPDVNYRLAKCYDALGDPKKTADALDQVLKFEKSRFKQRSEALYMLGKLHGSMKDYKKAVAAYEKMLSEGAGPFEDEVLNTTAFYYVQMGEYNEAAAKYNVLRRREDAKVARTAAYKLALLWIKAEKQDLAIAAIQDFAQQYPGDEQTPELLLRMADLFVKQKKPAQAMAVCEQLRNSFKTAPEAVGAGYILGTIRRERKEYKEAAAALDQTAKAAARDNRLKGLAAEALAQAAEIYMTDLADVESAIPRYEEAVGYARDSDSDRAAEILQQCYFRLGEYHFSKQKWAAALDYYVMLKNLNPNVNVLPRITKCQLELGTAGQNNPATSNVDRQILEQKIKDNEGTIIAAEAEVFLLDSRFSEALKRQGPTVELAAQYEKLLAKYGKDVLKQDQLGTYLCVQAGAALAQAPPGGLPARENLVRAIAAYEKALAIDPSAENRYRVPALESIALLARQAGDPARARAAEQRLFEMKKAELDKNKGDKLAEMKALEYMKTIFSHSDTPELAQQSIDAAKKLIEERGPLSDLSREAKFYIGELYYMKKDFSNAAKTFKEYVSTYGPPQGPDGELKGGPWKSAPDDETARRVCEAAARVAHSWYMQGHEQNMVKQYEWIVRNLPVHNRWLPEAHYWLAVELGKGEKGKLPENKKKMAEALWKNLVNPSTDFDDPSKKNQFHPWVHSGDESVRQYVRCAVLRAGQLWSEVDDHESAAGAFNAFLRLFPQRDKTKKQGGTERDPMFDAARYALGREYVALRNFPKLIDTYKPYMSGLRDDPYRISALRTLGFYATQTEQWDVAVEAYATILDEYGPNKAGPTGKPVPVPVQERLRERSGKSGGWDGIRLSPPKDLDFGEIRYALGYMYWKQESFAHCAQTLTPFLTAPALRNNKHRDRALFMAGQSLMRAYDYAAAASILLVLVREHPRFEAIEEAYVVAARACVETKNWDDLTLLCRTFLNEWGRSDRRSRMDLYAALGQIGAGKVSEGMSLLTNITRSDTYEDVKADAYYHLALATLTVNPAETTRAYDYAAKSVSTFARDFACLEAGRMAMKLKHWEDARRYLERVGRDFPKAHPDILREANSLLPEVHKQLAKSK
ncbi:MAG: tetratricopeptide repeat protein [Thermoguttaceae bacterium]